MCNSRSSLLSYFFRNTHSSGQCFRIQYKLFVEDSFIQFAPISTIFSFKSFLKTISIPYLDTTAAFANEPEPMSLWVAVDDAHPNARAHGIVAEAVLDFVGRGEQGP